MGAVCLALRLLWLTPMTPQELRDRTMECSLAAFRLTRPMMREPLARDVARQLFRAATAASANYRSACLGRSTREFIAKLGIVREEADEARELAAIISAAYQTSKARSVRKKLSNDK